MDSGQEKLHDIKDGNIFPFIYPGFKNPKQRMTNSDLYHWVVYNGKNVERTEMTDGRIGAEKVMCTGWIVTRSLRTMFLKHI